MGIQLTHRAKLLAMDITISAMQRTRKSGILSGIFRGTYRIVRDGRLIVWGGVLVALGIAGFLIGYLAYYIIPK
jgi:hypothetical protein